MEDEQGESARPAYKDSGWPFCARFLPAAYFSAPVKGCVGIASMSVPLALPPFPIPGEGGPMADICPCAQIQPALSQFRVKGYGGIAPMIAICLCPSMRKNHRSMAASRLPFCLFPFPVRGPPWLPFALALKSIPRFPHFE